MTHSASEVFTMQIARAAAKTANKFLYARGLNKADRDDVISAALLYCWENRANYSLTTTLETWFMNTVRNAYQDLQRGKLPDSGTSINQLQVGDTTYRTTMLRSTIKTLMNKLTPTEQHIAGLTAQGFTRADIMARGISKRVFDSARSRIRRLLGASDAETAEDGARFIATYARTRPAPNLDELDEMPQAEPSSIDLEIAQLDFAPSAGKDCPPCWRCLWFEGFMPSGKLSVRMQIEDDEVREAMKNTEARKIDIAQQVRYGTI